MREKITRKPQNISASSLSVILSKHEQEKETNYINLGSARGGTFHIHVIRSKFHFSLQYQYFDSNTTRENTETY